MSEADPLGSAAQEWFRKGTDAMNRQNWDFAIECFTNAVKMKPDAVLFRQTKHLCCRKMYGDNGTGAKMAGMKLMGTRSKIKKARAKEDWATLDELAEEGIPVNPWDAQLFADLGEASAQLDRGEIAKYAFSKAVEIDRQNIEFLKRLGHVLHERGEYKEARACFKKIYELDPSNSDARSMMGRIDADMVMDRGNYDKAKSTQDVKVEKEATNAYEEDRRARRGRAQNQSVAPGESVEMDLRAAIRKDPKNVAQYLKLADFLRGERQLAQSMEILDQALEVSGGDVAIREKKEDVELEIMKEKTAEAVERARQNPDKERLQEKAKTMKVELITREIEVLAARTERNPNDMKMKFELAERYRKTQQFAQAIPLYQQTVADSRLTEDALVNLGECFVRAGKLDLGRRQFEKALETLSANDKPDSFKMAHYWLGRIYEKAEKNDLAENHYNEILSVDFTYRDVQDRLSKLQGDDAFSDVGGLD